MPDITIVGGGPAGTFSARLLAMSGRDVTVLEDHHCSGVPVHCAGVVSAEVLENFGVRPKVNGTISSADVVLPNGEVIPVGKKTPYAYIVDRADMDQKMADLAEGAGAQIRYGVRYKNHVVDQQSVTVNTSAGSIKSDLLIGADGQSSLVAASLGGNHARAYIRGYQVDLDYVMDDQDKMVLSLGNEVAPGFFAWRLPLADRTRVGICVGTDYGAPAAYMSKYLKDNGFDDKKKLATYVGKIPIGGRRTSYSDRILLIGDAAGQVKPVSGGGLYPISKVAPLLRETVDRAYSMGVFSSSVLALYERAWKREIGKSIDGGMRLRRFYDKLDDEELNKVGHLFNRPEVLQHLDNIDIDDPSTVVKPILKEKGIKVELMKVVMRNIL